MKEGHMSKGGTNDAPSTPRPEPARGQGRRRSDDSGEKAEAARVIGESGPSAIGGDPIGLLFYVLLLHCGLKPEVVDNAVGSVGRLRDEMCAGRHPGWNSECVEHALRHALTIRKMVAEDEAGQTQDINESPLQVLFYVLLRDYVAGPALDHAVAKTQSIVGGSGYAEPTELILHTHLQVRAAKLAGAMPSASIDTPPFSSRKGSE